MVRMVQFTMVSLCLSIFFILQNGQIAVLELEIVPDAIQVSERSRRVTFAGQLGTLGNKSKAESSKIP